MPFININLSGIDLAGHIESEPEVLLEALACLACDIDTADLPRFARRFAKNTGGSNAEELTVHLLRALADALEAANAA